MSKELNKEEILEVFSMFGIDSLIKLVNDYKETQEIYWYRKAKGMTFKDFRKSIVKSIGLN